MQVAVVLFVALLAGFSADAAVHLKEQFLDGGK